MGSAQGSVGIVPAGRTSAGVALLLGLVVLLLGSQAALAPRAMAAGEAPLASTTSPSPVPADGVVAAPIVRGVFFYSPTCPHCEIVIRDHLPGMFERFGGTPGTVIDESIPREDVAFHLMSNGTLELLMVDVSVEAGAGLFLADSERLGLDPAVPRLAIADRQLLGSEEIPAQLPAIVEIGLAGEGIDWPTVPGLSDALAPLVDPDTPDGSDPTGTGSANEIGPVTTTLWDRLDRDLPANLVAVAVLVLLVASLIAVPILAARGRLLIYRYRPRWLVPALAVAGIGISVYLGYVEANGLAAACGPVGDCNAVQDSEYAMLFGALPTWALGVVGYSIVLGGSIVATVVDTRTATLLILAVAATALAGTAFSAWLTFLEPFVIGATCLWCILSALTMVSLLWLTAGDGAAVLRRAGPVT